jgi:hypothetical protein
VGMGMGMGMGMGTQCWALSPSINKVFGSVFFAKNT